MFLTGPKLDIKDKKDAFVNRPCFAKLRRVADFLCFLNWDNTTEIFPVLVFF